MNNTFFHIIHKQNCHSKELYNSSFEKTYDFYNDAFKFEFIKKENHILKLLFYMFLTSFNTEIGNIINMTKSKFIFFESVLSNSILTQDTKNDFILQFCSAQKKYHTLKRFLYRIKLKRQTNCHAMDLYMNPISIKNKNVISIFQNGKNYLFTINDLKNIIENALCNCVAFCPEPVVSKNPYNNVPFSKTNLYNIYFFMKKNMMIIPELFHLYFNSGFHLKRFLERNETAIQKKYIQKYLNSCHNVLILNHIFQMLKIMKKLFNINIDVDFPNDVLINVMKPYLQLYLIQQYSFDYSERYYASKQLHKRLRTFYDHNPSFGRKIAVLKNGKINKYTFNTDHIPFIDYDKNKFFENYEKSHLSIDYTIDYYESHNNNIDIDININEIVEDDGDERQSSDYDY
jgi:hypothetical protein